MIKLLEMKICNMLLKEKLEKYQHYHQVKSINMNTGDEILLPDQEK